MFLGVSVYVLVCRRCVCMCVFLYMAMCMFLAHCVYISLCVCDLLFMYVLMKLHVSLCYCLCVCLWLCKSRPLLAFSARHRWLPRSMSSPKISSSRWWSPTNAIEEVPAGFRVHQQNVEVRQCKNKCSISSYTSLLVGGQASSSSRSRYRSVLVLLAIVWGGDATVHVPSLTTS